MEETQQCTPLQAFDKNPLELRVEDVYDISYVIGKDLLKLNRGGREVSDLQFKIVRVLEMFEIMVSTYNLSLEELKIERDNLKGDLERVLEEGLRENQISEPDRLIINLKDPNRPRFTMQELKAVLQERNQLKAQLLLAQEELQLYKRGVQPQQEPNMLDVEQLTYTLQSATQEKDEDRSTIQKLFSFRRK